MGQLSLRDIRKSYGAVDVIKDVDLDVRDGEMPIADVGARSAGLRPEHLRVDAGARLLAVKVAAERACIDASQGALLAADRSWVLGYDSNGRFLQ